MAYHGSTDYDRNLDRIVEIPGQNDPDDANIGLVEQRHTGFLVLTDARPADTKGSPVNGGPLDATRYIEGISNDSVNPFPNAYYGQLTYDAVRNRFRVWQPGKAGSSDSWKDLIS